MTLIWDFDDTIVSTNAEFEKTNILSAQIIAKELSDFRNAVTVEEIISSQRKLDVELVKTYGFVPPRYIHSWLETYEKMAKQAGVTMKEEVKLVLKETVEDLYLRQFKNIPGSKQVMERLYLLGYNMLILTAGQEDIQKRKVEQAGVRDYVKDVCVYSRKTPDTLKEIMDMYPSDDYVMIGNSLKSDIHPALENNVWGFHFERETWEADFHDIDKQHPKYVHVSDLKEIPKKIEEICRNKHIAV